jgi:RpiR family carbohydrate utilization transcriptional regulator
MERTASGRNCLLRIRSVYPSLARVHRRIADRILENPRGIVTMPVTELAELAEASEASIVLFCKKLGYRGFQHLKFVLAEEVFTLPSADIHEEIDRDDEVPVIVKKVFNTSIQALNDTLRILDQSALEAAAEAVLAADRVLIVGTGISGMIAEDLWMKLFRINRNVACHRDPTWMKMAASTAAPGDLVFAVSHSGSTKAVIETLAMARSRGARTIGLTNYQNSPVSKLVDILLLTSSRESGVREEEMTSRIAQLAVVDSLFVTVANRSYEASAANLRHTREAVADEKI